MNPWTANWDEFMAAFCCTAVMVPEADKSSCKNSSATYLALTEGERSSATLN